MPKTYCENCNITHSSIMCFNKPRKAIKPSQKPIAPESKEYKKKRKATRKAWLELNPPNIYGEWTCYLQISTKCPIVLTNLTLRLEHIKSKVRYPELRFDVTNIDASCEYCNSVKGSWDIEELIERFPHLSRVVKL